MNLWFTLIAIELGLVAFGLLAAVWVGQMLAKRRDREAVRLLVNRVTEQKGQRAEAIRAFLRKNFELNDERLEERTLAILREELRLYQRFANLYLRRDAGSAANFQIALEACVDPYWQLKGGSPEIEFVAPQAGQTEAFPAIDESELLSLRAEVERLQQRSELLDEQLGLAMTNLARMLDEYSSLFDGKTVDDLSGEALIAEAGNLISELDPGDTEPADSPPEESDAVDAGPDEGAVPNQTVVDAPTDPAPTAAIEETMLATASETDAEVESPVTGSQPVTDTQPVADARDEPVDRSEAPERPIDDTNDHSSREQEPPVDLPIDVDPAPEPPAAAPPSVDPSFSPRTGTAPAAEELMASLDANLPEEPVVANGPEPELEKPDQALSDEEIDALFDAEPDFDLIDPSSQDAAGDERRSSESDDGERVAIVQKDGNHNLVV